MAYSIKGNFYGDGLVVSSYKELPSDTKRKTTIESEIEVRADSGKVRLDLIRTVKPGDRRQSTTVAHSYYEFANSYEAIEVLRRIADELKNMRIHGEMYVDEAEDETEEQE
jgi:hypothetical protein